jgi:hypothetical protein
LNVSKDPPNKSKRVDSSVEEDSSEPDKSIDKSEESEEEEEEIKDDSKDSSLEESKLNISKSSSSPTSQEKVNSLLSQN